MSIESTTFDHSYTPYQLVLGHGILGGMVRITVVYGGTSAEREVSLRSGSSVAEALRHTKSYAVTLRDAAESSMDVIADCDVVFPMIHGIGGEDGRLQAELDRRNIAYVGSPAGASKHCLDKELYRQQLIAGGFTVPEGYIVTAAQYAAHPLARQPHVLKPVSGGSSIDTFIRRNPEAEPPDALTGAFRRHRRLLLEQLIVGTELTVGILGEHALPVIEIIPPEGGEFDYANKYNGRTQELCPPLHVHKTVQAQAQKLALDVHVFTGCRDFSRTDILQQAGTGKLYLLDTNTLPGMTAASLYPSMAAAAGLPMPELCAQLVSFALSR